MAETKRTIFKAELKVRNFMFGFLFLSFPLLTNLPSAQGSDIKSQMTSAGFPVQLLHRFCGKPPPKAINGAECWCGNSLAYRVQDKLVQVKCRDRDTPTRYDNNYRFFTDVTALKYLGVLMYGEDFTIYGLSGYCTPNNCAGGGEVLNYDQIGVTDIPYISGHLVGALFGQDNCINELGKTISSDWSLKKVDVGQSLDSPGKQLLFEYGCKHSYSKVLKAFGK